MTAALCILKMISTQYTTSDEVEPLSLTLGEHSPAICELRCIYSEVMYSTRIPSHTHTLHTTTLTLPTPHTHTPHTTTLTLPTPHTHTPHTTTLTLPTPHTHTPHTSIPHTAPHRPFTAGSGVSHTVTTLGPRLVLSGEGLALATRATRVYISYKRHDDIEGSQTLLVRLLVCLRHLFECYQAISTSIANRIIVP